MTDPTDNQPIPDGPTRADDITEAGQTIAAARVIGEDDDDLPEWDRVRGDTVLPVATVAAPDSWATGLPDGRNAGADETLVQEVPMDQSPFARREFNAPARGPWASAPEPGRRLLSAPRMSARAAVPAPVVSAERADCPHCGGTGYVPSISDYLRESIGLIGDTGDDVIRQFYATLLRAAPDIASLFPSDLLAPESPATPPDWADFTDEGKHEMLVRAGLIGKDDPLPPDPEPPRTGRGQRDKLLGALKALANAYDPASTEKMAQLDTALASFGRHHAAFVRADGTIQGATWEEYAAVKTALFATLVTVAGAAWKPEFTAAWSQAYDYAAGVMLVEQFRSGFTSPRFPRA